MRRLHTDEGTRLWASRRQPHSATQQLVLALLVLNKKKLLEAGGEVRASRFLTGTTLRSPLYRTRHSSAAAAPDAWAGAASNNTKRCEFDKHRSMLQIRLVLRVNLKSARTIRDKRVENAAVPANKASTGKHKQSFLIEKHFGFLPA